MAISAAAEHEASVKKLAVTVQNALRLALTGNRRQFEVLCGSVETATADTAPGLFRALAANGALIARHSGDLSGLLAAVAGFRIDGLDPDHPVVQPFAELVCSIASANAALLPDFFAALAEQMLPPDEEESPADAWARQSQPRASPAPVDNAASAGSAGAAPSASGQEEKAAAAFVDLDRAALPSAALVTVVHALLRAVPTGLPSLYKALSSAHPHHTRSRAYHERFGASLLLLGRKLPAVEDRVVASILARVVDIDVMVRAGMEASDAAQTLAERLLAQEAAAKSDKARSEIRDRRLASEGEVRDQLARVRPAADSLDALMELLFQHCDRQLGTEPVGWPDDAGMAGAQSALESSRHGDDSSSGSGSSSSSSASSSASTSAAGSSVPATRSGVGSEEGGVGAVTGWAALRDRRRKHMLALLLSSFEHAMLPARPRFTHFLLLFVCRLGPDLADALVGRLINTIRSPTSPSVQRASCAAYAGGFLARAAYLHHTTVRSALFFLVAWARRHLHVTSAAPAACPDSGALLPRRLVPLASLHGAAHRERTAFYAVVQACLYVVCFRARALVSTPHGRSFLASLGWEELLLSAADPLHHCVTSVSSEFARVAMALRLVSRRSHSWPVLRRVARGQWGGTQAADSQLLIQTVPSPAAAQNPGQRGTVPPVAKGAPAGAAVAAPTLPQRGGTAPSKPSAAASASAARGLLRAAASSISTPGGLAAAKAAQVRREAAIRESAFRMAGSGRHSVGAGGGHSGAGPGGVHSGGGDGSGSGTPDGLRQTQSFFPLDPYLLARSGRFVGRLFCEWGDVALGSGVRWRTVRAADAMAAAGDESGAWEALGDGDEAEDDAAEQRALATEAAATGLDDDGDSDEVASDASQGGGSSAIAGSAADSHRSANGGHASRVSVAQSHVLSAVMARAMAGAKGMDRRMRGLTGKETDYRAAVEARRANMGGLEEGFGALGLTQARSEAALASEAGGMGQVAAAGAAVVREDPSALYGSEASSSSEEEEEEEEDEEEDEEDEDNLQGGARGGRALSARSTSAHARSGSEVEEDGSESDASGAAASSLGKPLRSALRQSKRTRHAAREAIRALAERRPRKRGRDEFDDDDEVGGFEELTAVRELSDEAGSDSSSSSSSGSDSDSSSDSDSDSDSDAPDPLSLTVMEQVVVSGKGINIRSSAKRVRISEPSDF